MSHTPHELAADFPELVDRIHALKVGNAHFAKLLASYEDVNARVHRAETLVEPISDDAETQLRKERSHLKDELYRMLTADA